MRKFKNIVIFLLLIVLVAACSTVPITGRSQLHLVPSGTLLSMSQEQYKQFLEQAELSDDAEMVKMVNDVGKNIAKAVQQYLVEHDMEEELDNYDWEFNLVDDASINAFAMPGGKIVVFKGILQVAQNPEGLAVIMGHEIAHVIANHGNERMSQGLVTQLGGMALSTALSDRPAATQQLFLKAYGAGAQIGVLLPYSRAHESEADHMGLIFMAMAGYNPKEAPRFWERMAAKKDAPEPPEFLSTHPADSRRIRNLEKLLPEAMEYYESASAEKG